MTTIDPPHLADSPALKLALIHLTVPSSEIMTAMGPAFTELHDVLRAQHIAPTGPWFAHYLDRPSGVFDFELCSPVNDPVQPTGRVTNGNLRAARVVRTIHHGPYEGLVSAWGELMAWTEANGHHVAPDLWEVYVVDPSTSPDPTTWRTELNAPLLASTGN